MWLAADILATHRKRAAKKNTDSGEVLYSNYSDSIIECFGEIDGTVPRGQDVSEMKGNITKLIGRTT
jgi:hypothetical protein